MKTMSAGVYLETSVISYLAGRPSRDLFVAAHQQLTQAWWQAERSRFSLCASPLVLREASQGDTIAAAARLRWLEGIPLIAVTKEAERLAERLLQDAALPPKAAADALHIAIAACHRIEFLMTWNCTHIANATKRPLIERVCRNFGVEPPILCTPEELMGEAPDVD